MVCTRCDSSAFCCGLATLTNGQRETLILNTGVQHFLYSNIHIYSLLDPGEYKQDRLLLAMECTALRNQRAVLS
jgi:hypothetical protein